MFRKYYWIAWIWSWRRFEKDRRDTELNTQLRTNWSFWTAHGLQRILLSLLRWRHLAAATWRKPFPADLLWRSPSCVGRRCDRRAALRTPSAPIHTNHTSNPILQSIHETIKARGLHSVRRRIRLEASWAGCFRSWFRPTWDRWGASLSSGRRAGFEQAGSCADCTLGTLPSARYGRSCSTDWDRSGK